MYARKRDTASLHFVEGWLLAFKRIDKLLCGLFQLQCVATGENINGSVFKFRPGVDGEMGFGDHDHAAYTDGSKLVELCSNNRRSGRVCRGYHDLFNFCDVIKKG